MKLRFYMLILALIISAGCADEKVKPKINKDLKVEELPAQESWNSTIVFSDSGKIKAVLLTGHLRLFAEAQETLLDSGVTVDFYDDLEMKSTTLTSDRGKVEDATKNLFAIDNVVAVNDTVKVTTDELMWRNRDRKIVSDKFVTITTPKEKIQGYGFESDQGLKNYVIRDITYITRTDTTGVNR